MGSCSLRAGRSFPDKSEALLAGFASSTVPAAEKLPEGQGFTVARVDPTGDGMTWLALTRNPHGSLELFGAMATALPMFKDLEFTSLSPQGEQIYQTGVTIPLLDREQARVKRGEITG